MSCKICGMKILVIDDSNALRLMMVKMLRDLGYKDVIAAGSAEEAIPMVFNEGFDLVLLDWNLPKMSGIDLLRYLKKNSKTEKIPVVMVTTVQEKSNILQAIKVGLQGYIIKPISREILLARLKEIESKVVLPSA